MKRFITSFAVFAVMGCTPPGLDDVETEYAENVQRLGILPIYPPREDFNLGDIFLASVNKRSVADLEYVWAGHVPDARERVEESLGRQLALTDTKELAGNEEAKGNKTHQDDLRTAGELESRSEFQLSSLPVVAFPSIEGSTALAAASGFTGLQTAFGLGGRRDTRVRLDFVGVRSLGMPRVAASDFNDEILARTLTRLPEAVNALQREVVLGGRRVEGGVGFQAAGGPTRCVSLTMITQLYLTREIDYTYFDARVLAASLRETRALPVPGEEGDGPSDVAPAPTVVNVFGVDEDGRISFSAEELEKLQEGLTEGEGDAAGRAAALQAAAAGQVTFTRRFQRPVVIGWDGYDLRIPDAIRNAARKWERDQTPENARSVFAKTANIIAFLLNKNPDDPTSVTDPELRADLVRMIQQFRIPTDSGFPRGYGPQELRALANSCKFEELVGE